MTGTGLVVETGDAPSPGGVDVPAGRPGGDVGSAVGAGSDPDGAVETTVNEVTLRGRVSRAPELRELPSGTCIATVRLSVGRSSTPMAKGSKQGSDWVDCVAWGARQRRRVSSWRVGDIVEVEGALRRRFYRGGGGTAMPLEVEVLAGRMVRRADRRPSRDPDAPGS